MLSLVSVEFQSFLCGRLCMRCSNLVVGLGPSFCVAMASSSDDEGPLSVKKITDELMQAAIQAQCLESDDVAKYKKELHKKSHGMGRASKDDREKQKKLVARLRRKMEKGILAMQSNNKLARSVNDHTTAQSNSVKQEVQTAAKYIVKELRNEIRSTRTAVSAADNAEAEAFWKTLESSSEVQQPLLLCN